MRSTIALTAVLAMTIAAAAQAPQPWTLKIQPVELGSAKGANGVQVTVSKRGALASWIESEDEPTLKFAERTATGWSAPVKVASGEDWFITEADTPSVLRLSTGALVGDWMQSSSDEFEASNLRLVYSKDDGKTWSKSFLPHHDGTITQHAFATLFELANGNLGLVYLDGRLTLKDREHGPMTLRYAAYNTAWTEVSDRAIDTKVCDCCTMNVAITTDGPIAIYRNRTDDEIRDIYVTRYEKGVWTAGKAVHDDGWQIHACPINGPAITAQGNNVAAAWFTAKNDQGQAWAAFSKDGGRTWGQPIRLDDAASMGKVEIEMLDDGSAVASWIEFANQRSTFRIRHIDSTGARSAPITVAGAAGTGRVGGVPRMVRAGSELVFAWVDTPENGGVGGVKTAVAALLH